MGAALAAVMTLSACSAGIIAGKPDIDKTFTAQAKITAGSETASGQLSRTADGCWTLTVNEPFALQGLTVTLENGETTFSMLGYECKTDFSDSAVSAVKLLAEAYETAAENADGFTDGVFSGTDENGTFSVTLGENGMPALISAGGFSVQLSEYTDNISTENQSDELILLE